MMIETSASSRSTETERPWSAKSRAIGSLQALLCCAEVDEVCLGNLRLIDVQRAPSLVRQGAGIDGEHPELSLRLVLTASALTAIRALSL